MDNFHKNKYRLSLSIFDSQLELSLSLPSSSIKAKEKMKKPAFQFHLRYTNNRFSMKTAPNTRFW